jgi:hypothetical protein
MCSWMVLSWPLDVMIYMHIVTPQKSYHITLVGYSLAIAGALRTAQGLLLLASALVLLATPPMCAAHSLGVWSHMVSCMAAISC